MCVMCMYRLEYTASVYKNQSYIIGKVYMAAFKKKDKIFFLLLDHLSITGKKVPKSAGSPVSVALWKQCCASVTFLCGSGSGSVDPYH
jgi:hypothetical protein